MESFDWEFYINKYPDLKRANINTKEKAIQHWIKYGKKEGRLDKDYQNKITIITPCIRPENLKTIKNSLDFNCIHEWIIVYDNVSLQKNFDHEQISEYNYTCLEGRSGNPQRNYALTKIKNENTYIYYLDDDNIVHPDLFKLNLNSNKIYTFNQLNKDGTIRLKGNCINIGKIDTAMFLVYYPLVKETKWILDIYEADGHYILECYLKNKSKWVYIDKDLCYYNYI
jgi:hypothetical protein